MPIGLLVDWSGASASQSAEFTRIRADRPADVAALMGPGTAKVAHVSVVADARLDNLAELCDELGVDHIIDPAEAFARAYLRWGDRFPEHVAGDFSVVLWDLAARRLYAARDPFGTRPLFYRHAGRQVWLSDRVDRILGTFERDPTLNDYAILEYLLASYRSTDATFFQGVLRVPAGHLVSIESSIARSIKYWKLPDGLSVRTESQPTRAFLEEFARLFEQAVDRRLAKASPTVVHVSGGIDSSSIATACANLLRDKGHRGGVVAATASYPGLACDEGSYVRALEERLGLHVVRWTGTASEPVDILDPASDFPGSKRTFTDGTVGDLEIASGHSAGVILSGTGGDELTIGMGTVRDMISHREWVRAARCVLLYDGPKKRLRLRRIKILLGQFLPPVLRRERDSLKVKLPPWVASEFTSMARAIAIPLRPPSGSSNAASHIWARLNSPQLISGIEAHQRQAAPFGVEYRFPFLDRHLVRLVLATASGYWPRRARPHQDALRDLLPSLIGERRSKADLTPAFQRRILLATRAIERQFSDGLWCSQRYVPREQALAGWRRFRCEEADGLQCRTLWAMVTLEAWLRRRFGYSTKPLGDTGHASGQNS